MDMGCTDPRPCNERRHGSRMDFGWSCVGVLAPRAQCAWTVLISTPSKNGPSGEQTFWPRKLHEHTTQAQHNPEHKTVGNYFIIFDMALGLTWPFAVPKKKTSPPPPLGIPPPSRATVSMDGEGGGEMVAR